MLIYIDGDNSPGGRTSGIEYLGENDVVKIYYANSNSFYSKKDNRDKLTGASKCNITFHGVAQESDAADFGIAVDCARECTLGNHEVVCLISEDKHFNTIRRHIKKQFENVTVVCSSSIQIGFAMLSVLEIKDVEQLEQNLVKIYGNAGREAFKNIKRAFENVFLDNERSWKKRFGWFSYLIAREKK